MNIDAKPRTKNELNLLRSNIQKHILDLQGGENNEKELEATRSTLMDLDNYLELGLIVALELDETTKSDIYNWFKNVVDSNFVLDFTVDPEILGGVQIIHKGSFADYSLKSKLKKVLTQNENFVGKRDA